jgi:hypothetical protein
MLIWLYGTSMRLRAVVRDENGNPQAGATVTYQIRDRSGAEVFAGTLTETAASGDLPVRYEDVIDAQEILEDYDGDEATMRGLLYRARVVAMLVNGRRSQSSPRIHFQHDTD